jgi:hypothetical protein
MDTSRFTEATGFEPRHTSRSAFEDFAATVRPGPLHAVRVSALIDSAAAVIGGRVGRDG